MHCVDDDQVHSYTIRGGEGVGVVLLREGPSCRHAGVCYLSRYIASIVVVTRSDIPLLLQVYTTVNTLERLVKSLGVYILDAAAVEVVTQCHVEVHRDLGCQGVHGT